MFSLKKLQNLKHFQITKLDSLIRKSNIFGTSTKKSNILENNYIILRNVWN